MNSRIKQLKEEDLQTQIDELQAEVKKLKGRAEHLKGRISVLEYANAQATKLLYPPSLEQVKQDIKSKKPDDFTKSLIGNPFDFHNGVVDQLTRLRQELHI